MPQQELQNCRAALGHWRGFSCGRRLAHVLRRYSSHLRHSTSTCGGVCIACGMHHGTNTTNGTVIQAAWLPSACDSMPAKWSYPWGRKSCPVPRARSANSESTREDAGAWSGASRAMGCHNYGAACSLESRSQGESFAKHSAVLSIVTRFGTSVVCKPASQHCLAHPLVRLPSLVFSSSLLFALVCPPLALFGSSVVCLLEQKDVVTLGITCRALQQTDRGFATGEQAFPLGCVR